MSDTQIIIGLAAIVFLGVGAQWIAKRRDFPSLLLLLPAGLLAGNVGPLVDPEKLFGDTLFPGVTMLVGLLLFQSGLQLRVRDLPSEARHPVVRLNTVAAMLTLIGAGVAVRFIFAPGNDLAALAGAILVVSGPTVVGPLLDIVRPREPVGSILRWEGTMLDPIGATMGVIALNVVLANERGGVHPMLQMAARLGLGVLVGVVAGALLVFVMSRFLVTDQMEAAVALLFAVAAFSAAEVFLSEAGLFATVTLGLVVANQRIVPVARISGFGETLEVLIIGSLFVVLGALVEIDEMIDRIWGILALVAVLVLVVRPVAVGLSLFGTKVPTRGRLMIAWLDPRGVVAASTAAAFTGTLATAGIEADFLLPVVFGVILGTGLIYGLSGSAVGSMLGVRSDPPEGVALVGEAEWFHGFASELRRAGAKVVLVGADEGSEPISDGSGPLPRESIPAGESELRDRVAQHGIGKAVVDINDALTGELLTAALVEVLGRRNVYRVASAAVSALERTVATASTEVAFGGRLSTEEIASMASEGARFTALREPPVAAAHEGGPDSPGRATAVAVVDSKGRVDLSPKPGTPESGSGSTTVFLVAGSG